VIVIDPGHGAQQDSGSDREHSKSASNNATSPKLKLLEKDLTLDLAKRIATRIEQSKEASTFHVSVKLTRDTDSNPDFAERAKTAASWKAKCFVSIHFNASDSHASTGPRAIVQQRSQNPNFDADVEFGEKLSKAVEAASKLFRVTTPKASLHDDHELHDGIGSYLFYQLNLHPETKMIPSCHLEVDFMDNVDVESLLLGAKRDAVFDAWAEAIANALIAQVK
jgi:N-acetylmuramoyl-L-alanine amidase